MTTLLSRNSANRVIPGFGLSLGFTIFYLALLVLIPLSAIFLKTFTMSWDAFVSAVTSPRVMASYRLSFGAALIGAAINVVFGGIVAWVLVRYQFPGKRFVDAVVDDLPNQVMQPGGAHAADVHAGPFANRLEALEDLDVFRRIGRHFAASPSNVGGGGGGSITISVKAPRLMTSRPLPPRPVFS